MTGVDNFLAIWFCEVYQCPGFFHGDDAEAKGRIFVDPRPIILEYDFRCYVGYVSFPFFGL
jgi:hypothetical protein